MKLNRKLVLVLALLLSVAMATTGTLAYLSDTDADVNVMTLGNVTIEQFEMERVFEDGKPVEGVEGTDFTADYGISHSYKLQPFTQGKPAYPAVYTKGAMAWDEFQQLWNQVGAPGSNALFDDSMMNVVDKFVFVKNTGKSDAYYRTIIAIEAPEGLHEDAIHTSFNANSRFDYNADKDGVQNSADSNKFYTTIDGIRYLVYVATYTEILTPNEVSRPSLLQLYLDPACTNEDVALFGNTWDVLVVSQAVQAAGFDSAEVALDAAFKKVSENSHPWMDGMDGDQEPDFTTVKTGTELNSAIASAKDGDTIYLAEDVTISNQLMVDKAVTINLNGQTLTTENGYGGLNLKGGASVVNGTINHTGNTAAIKAFQVEKIENVTINVTETAGKTKGGIVVQNGAGDYVGSIKNVTINGATNGIECYRSTNEQAIGVMDNVTINATQNGIYLNGAGRIGSIINCDIHGDFRGINAYLANLWHISLDIKDSTISGGDYGIDIWDEAATNAGSTVTFNYDADSTFKGVKDGIKVTLQDEISCTINGVLQ